MENLYEILNVTSGATIEEIRKSYLKLAKLYHPDKNIDANELSENHLAAIDPNNVAKVMKDRNSKQFVKINHAWKILSNSVLRKEFDIKWKERILHQAFPIQDNVSFSDFDFDEQDNIFLYPCRCGSSYVLSETEAELLYDLVCCETCSLTIQVKYESEI